MREDMVTISTKEMEQEMSPLPLPREVFAMTTPSTSKIAILPTDSTLLSSGVFRCHLAVSLIGEY